MQYLTIAARCLIGVVFLTSSIGKVAGRQAFTAFVASVRDMVPWPVLPARPVAVLVVALEFAVWSLMAWPSAMPAVIGFALAAALLAVFVAGIVSVVHRGVRAPCRCFGTAQTPLGPRHLVRNLLLLAVAGVGAAAAQSTAPAHPGGIVVAACIGLILAGAVVLFDDLLDLFRPIEPVDNLPGAGSAGLIRGDMP